MPATYEPIATTTLGSAATTITFSSIPATYTDLRLVLVPNGISAGDVLLTVNSDTGTNYSFTAIWGNGSSASSYRVTSYANYDLNYNTNNSDTIPVFHTVDIFSYAGNTNKTMLSTGQTDRNGSGEVQYGVGLWRSTAAITSVRFALTGTNTYYAGTTATLYGIKAA